MNQLAKLTLFLASCCLTSLATALPSDTEQPLEIQADEASFNQTTGEAIYKGNVLITQGTIEIEAEYLKISTNPQTQKFNKLKAKGSPAKFSQQIDEAGNMVISQGDNIDYSTLEAKLEISGNGYLNRIDNKVSADYILYMVNSGAFQANKTDTGRVSMTLQPQAAQDEN
ncbi:lipopolysaccharide transport periplasmic protein LptA [Marinomonas epiphytica]